MRIIDLITLCFLQALWAGYPAMLKICLREISVNELILIRYGLAALTLLVVTTLLKQHQRVPWRDFRWVMLGGVVVYIASPLLAGHGIKQSQALDVGILVSLEPLITYLLAFLFLRERLNRQQMIGVFVAIPGVLMLSDIFNQQMGGYSYHRLLGNFLFLLSLFCEGSHTVIGRAFSSRYSPIALSAYGFSVGFLLFLITHLGEASQLSLAKYSWKAWGAVLYLALPCSALGYTLWFVLLKRFTANAIAITLYLQSLLAAAIGYFLLGERLAPIAWIGAALILLGVAIGLYYPRHVRARSTPVG